MGGWANLVRERQEEAMGKVFRQAQYMGLVAGVLLAVQPVAVQHKRHGTGGMAVP